MAHRHRILFEWGGAVPLEACAELDPLCVLQTGLLLLGLLWEKVFSAVLI